MKTLNTFKEVYLKTIKLKKLAIIIASFKSQRKIDRNIYLIDGLF